MLNRSETSRQAYTPGDRHRFPDRLI